MKKLFLSPILYILLITTPILTQTINIDQIIQQASAWLNVPTLSLEKTEEGLTNETFIATHKNKTYIVRIGNKDAKKLGVNRVAEIACHTHASQHNIAPHILYADPETGNLVSEFVTGKTLTPDDLSDKETLMQVVTCIKKVHSIPYQKSFKTISLYKQIRLMLEQSQKNPHSAISHTQMPHIQQIVDTIEKHFSNKDKKQKYAGLCHYDLTANNFIQSTDKIWLIDWEYARWGNILIDLASLCIESNLNDAQRSIVLHAYFETVDKATEKDFNFMCIIQNLRDALWYDVRSQDIESIGTWNMHEQAKSYLTLFFEEKNKHLGKSQNCLSVTKKTSI